MQFQKIDNSYIIYVEKGEKNNRDTHTILY